MKFLAKDKQVGINDIPGHFQHRNLKVEVRVVETKRKRTFKPCNVCGKTITFEQFQTYVLENRNSVFYAKPHVIDTKWVAMDIDELGNSLRKHQHSFGGKGGM